MGLDASVYPNKSRIELSVDTEFVKEDAVSGQLYFDDTELEKKHWARLQPVAHHRIGNIAMVSFLRQEVTGILGPHCLIVRKVLYNGVHSGDTIPISEAGQLGEEVSKLRHAGVHSQETSQFLLQLEDLIQAAIREGNPIVF